MKHVAAAFVILGATALTARAQPPRESAPTPALQIRPISGRVVADDTGNPIANARVALTSSAPSSPVLTDRDGRFALNAPPGRYTLAVSKTGYARRETTGATTDEAVDIRLAHGAAISGRIMDARGDPVVNVRVVAETAAAATGAPIPGAAATLTDDRGEYRLGSLAADTLKIAVITLGAPTRRDMPEAAWP